MKRLKRKFHRLFLLITLITVIDIDSTLKAFPDSLIYVVNQGLSNRFFVLYAKNDSRQYKSNVYYICIN